MAMASARCKDVGLPLLRFHYLLEALFFFLTCSSLMSSLFSVLSSHVFPLDVKLVPTVVVSTVLSNLGPLYCGCLRLRCHSAG
jgi:hypothetical protein